MIGFVALGSNLGDREARLRDGLAGMARAGLEPLELSSVWETEPVGWPGAPWFLNMVARFRTDAPAQEVLDRLQRLELEAGRVRTAPNAPRVLDLDLLMLDDLRLHGPRLTIPHPRMWERRFVLAPLAELAPDLVNPGTGMTVVQTLESLGERPRVRRVGVLAARACGPL